MSRLCLHHIKLYITTPPPNIAQHMEHDCLLAIEKKEKERKNTMKVELPTFVGCWDVTVVPLPLPSLDPHLGGHGSGAFTIKIPSSPASCPPCRLILLLLISFNIYILFIRQTLLSRATYLLFFSFVCIRWFRVCIRWFCTKRSYPSWATSNR